MSPENCKRVQEAVKEAGTFLIGKLPEHLDLRQRNSYAHLWERIKSHMGKSYKECNDEQINDILAVIEHYRNNPC